MDANVSGKDITLQKTAGPTYTVSGTVSLSDGGSAEGASLQLKSGGSNTGGPVSAESGGGYTITGVPAGTYTIEAALTGYTTGTITEFTVSANVSGKDITLQKITGPTYTVSGTISLSGGGSAEGASLQLKRGDSNTGSPVSAGSDGGYTITGVPAGTYTIEVSLTGYTTGTIAEFTVSNALVTGKDLTLQKNDDTTAPAKVSGLSGTAGDGQVTLTWTDPTDTDLDHIEITWDNGGTTPQTVAKGTGTYTATGLSNGTAYTFTVKAVDASGNKNSGLTIEANPGTSAPADTIAPGKVSGLNTVTGNGQVTLNWTDPADRELAHFEITWTPGGTSPETAAKGTGTYTATGLNNGTEYTFTVKAKDTAGNTSEGEEIKAFAGKPTARVSVSFTALPQDETITLSGETQALSWSANTAIRVSVSESFAAYRWALDGVTLPGETGSSLTGYAGNLALKQHELTVFVSTGSGVEYAKSVIFTVTY